MMPECDGLQTLKKLTEKNINIPVLMLTANNTVDCAVSAMKLGAKDFVSKPFDFKDLSEVIKANLIKEEIRNSKQLAKSEVNFGNMVGKSDLMKNIFEQIAKVAKTESSILVTGESGTGKELIAKRIHDLSNRNNKNFVALNCAAIPETLIESELFGHQKGAFTGANSEHVGYCERADLGTLFLDEIGELSLSVQVKLLRFLQDQEFYKVGSSKPTRVNVRLVCATNKNLEKLVQQGKFREDLYYRTHVIHVKLPPLRDRFDDVCFLIPFFIKRFAKLYNYPSVSIAEDALRAMIEYSWPGNVRELENVVESLLALSTSDEIKIEDLPKKIVDDKSNFAQIDKKVFEGSLNFEQAEKVFETEMIVKALKRSNYVQTRAAQLLGISRRILKYKMDKLGISEHLN
ncbi:UNVERIFIED_CONTAM: hypothetical protein GTU68_027097 [Idotea baltica]|nr:hypothetical protein [Idotea baltica]